MGSLAAAVVAEQMNRTLEAAAVVAEQLSRTLEEVVVAAAVDRLLLQLCQTLAAEEEEEEAAAAVVVVDLTGCHCLAS